MKTKYYLTDVFGFKKYTGNQLATFVNCEHLSDEEMQHIAREINFSETTFLLSDKERDGGFDVRIFTPKSELDFAGHPTLGTAYIIKQLLNDEKIGQVILNLKVGQIPVKFEDDLLWMKQIQPTFGKTNSAELLAKVLGIQEEEIDSRFPIQEVSTGLFITIVPIKSMSVLKRVKVNLEWYEEFCETTEAKAIMIFCPEGYTEQQDISTRVFVNYLGIPEDPATGSATGCLAGYLVNYKYFDTSSINIVAGQGYEIDRPSQLYMKAENVNGNFDINVGGKVFLVADGMW